MKMKKERVDRFIATPDEFIIRDAEGYRIDPKTGERMPNEEPVKPQE